MARRAGGRHNAGLPDFFACQMTEKPWGVHDATTATTATTTTSTTSTTTSPPPSPPQAHQERTVLEMAERWTRRGCRRRKG
ncbi:hypothetical protein M0802_000311 [Mischocyttarus mexicanus]|nr:hypothetical protein M0802_000311 [Mischocyttarus mexicanus]